MRSAREISFRFRQETANLILFVAQPGLKQPEAIYVNGLPDPSAVRESIRGTSLEPSLLELAGRMLRRRIPLLGLELELPQTTPWRRDLLSGIESEQVYFRRVPYLDPQRAGDHKIIWELNRHQHLVVLAQAFLLTGDRTFSEEIRRELQGWFETNPFQQGINWASALEVAFRAWSWIWILHLAGDALGTELRSKLVNGLHQHGLHLEYNLSFFFSPNTHLLGEAAVLHLLGRLLPGLPRAAHWELLGAQVTEHEIERQIREDGSHFEQSSYYHVYAVDFFLLHLILARDVTPTYRARLLRAIDYLDALLGPDRRIPLLGDDDGGRLFHPFGPRDRFGRATMATASVVFHRPEWLENRDALYEQAVWWIGPDALKSAVAPRNASSRNRQSLFQPSGTVSVASGDVQIVFDVGSFGTGTAGHSHSDTLSVVVHKGDRDVLIDPGTYTYVGDPHWREWFRGSAAHNTIRINGENQAAASGPFRWLDPPKVEILGHELAPGSPVWVDAQCRYRGFTHRRRFWFQEPGLLCIVDELQGPPGEHDIEQFWHLGEECVSFGTSFQIGNSALLTLSASATASVTNGGEHGWRSRALGSREKAPVIRAAWRSSFPVIAAAVLDLEFTPLKPLPILKIGISADKSLDLSYTAAGRDINLHFPLKKGPREHEFLDAV